MQLSIVIVEYHCIEQVEQCLESINKYLSNIKWECIVVSNSEYPAEKITQMKETLAGAKIAINDRNRGYAGGVNRSLKECTAPYLLVLNPDCLLTDSNMKTLLDGFSMKQHIGAIGPKVIYSPDILQPSCRRFPYPWTFLLTRSVLSKLPWAWKEQKRYFMEDFDHKQTMDVDWISGGALLVNRAAIEDIGPMDERFFLYMEDVDWCRRLWAAGWRVQYRPFSVIRHDAQHDSLKGGLRRYMSPHTRYHLISMAKYFFKHGWKAKRPDAVN